VNPLLLTPVYNLAAHSAAQEYTFLNCNEIAGLGTGLKQARRKSVSLLSILKKDCCKIAGGFLLPEQKIMNYAGGYPAAINGLCRMILCLFSLFYL